MLWALGAERYYAQFTFAFAFEWDWLKANVAQNAIQMSAIAGLFYFKMEIIREHVRSESVFLGRKKKIIEKVFIYIIIADIDLPKYSIIYAKILVKSTHRFVCNCIEYESTNLKQNSDNDRKYMRCIFIRNICFIFFPPKDASLC